MSGARPKIIYFDLRGRVEPIRLAFEELGEAYDEDRVSPARWQTMKAETPFGALPIYQEGDLCFPQTLAIYQHIARTRGLYGLGEADHVAVDVVINAIDEAIGVVWTHFWQPDAKAQADAFANGGLETVLSRLERFYLEAGPTPGAWAGDTLTFADILAFRFLDEIDAFFPQALGRHARMADFHARFAARPRIDAYVASGRRPAAFGVGADGPKLDPRSPAVSPA